MGIRKSSWSKIDPGFYLWHHVHGAVTPVGGNDGGQLCEVTGEGRGYEAMISIVDILSSEVATMHHTSEVETSRRHLNEWAWKVGANSGLK